MKQIVAYLIFILIPSFIISASFVVGALFAIVIDPISGSLIFVALLFFIGSLCEPYFERG